MHIHGCSRIYGTPVIKWAFTAYEPVQLHCLLRYRTNYQRRAEQHHMIIITPLVGPSLHKVDETFPRRSSKQAYMMANSSQCHNSNSSSSGGCGDSSSSSSSSSSRRRRSNSSSNSSSSSSSSSRNCIRKAVGSFSFTQPIKLFTHSHSPPVLPIQIRHIPTDRQTL